MSVFFSPLYSPESRTVCPASCRSFVNNCSMKRKTNADGSVWPEMGKTLSTWALWFLMMPTQELKIDL